MRLIANFVEIEGFEPSSKQGTDMLSTRLSWPSFSCNGKTQATNRHLICLLFVIASQPAITIPAISAPLGPLSRRDRLGATSRFSTLCRNKANLLYFD